MRKDDRQMFQHLDDEQGERLAPPARFLVEVATFAERVRDEEQAAMALCDALLTGPAAWWQQRLRQSRDACTAGVVRQLLERMRSLLGSSPAKALQVTALAIEVANALDVTAYPCDYVITLRARAYRDHAYVLSFMGRHPDALDFCDRAQALFDQTPIPAYDLARLALVKASTLRWVGRSGEALALTRTAGETFIRFGDQSRYLAARQLEASTLYIGGDIEQALAIWKAVEASDVPLDEHATVRLANNLALCYAALGRPHEAIEYFRRCVAEYEMLGVDVERTRSRWALGGALAACGRYSDAVPVLRQAAREFEQLEVIADAGLVALDLAEALLVLGRHEEVPSICRDVIGQFTRAGMAAAALTALSFLREAVAAGQATPALVRSVSVVLRQLPREPLSSRA